MGTPPKTDLQGLSDGELKLYRAQIERDIEDISGQIAAYQAGLMGSKNDQRWCGKATAALNHKRVTLKDIEVEFVRREVEEGVQQPFTRNDAIAQAAGFFLSPEDLRDLINRAEELYPEAFR